MADPTRRISQYTNKTSAVRTVAQVSPQLGAMKENAASVQNDLVQMDSQVRAVVNGVP